MPPKLKITRYDEKGETFESQIPVSKFAVANNFAIEIRYEAFGVITFAFYDTKVLSSTGKTEVVLGTGHTERAAAEAFCALISGVRLVRNEFGPGAARFEITAPQKVVCDFQEGEK